jgi:hypothetical protein
MVRRVTVRNVSRLYALSYTRGFETFLREWKAFQAGIAESSFLKKGWEY